MSANNTPANSDGKLNQDLIDQMQQAPAKNSGNSSAVAKQSASDSSNAIDTNVNKASSGLVNQSLQDGIKTARKANDAFAQGYVTVRSAGAKQMLGVVEAANNATAAAVDSIDVDQLVQEVTSAEDPFSKGVMSLLG